MIKLGIVKIEDVKDSVMALATDFYRTMGGYTEINWPDVYGMYWTLNRKLLDGEDYLRFATVETYDGYYPNKIKIRWQDPRIKYFGIRLKVSLDEKDLIGIVENYDEVIKQKYIYYSQSKDIKFGWYPQDRVDNSIEEELEKLFLKARLQETGNKFTFRLNGSHNSFKEYSYNGKKYVRMIPKIDDYDAYEISDDYSKGEAEPKWFEVNPITWRLVKEDGKYSLIATKVLMTGQGINDKELDIYELMMMRSKNKRLDLQELLDKFVLKEILPNRELNQSIDLNIDLEELIKASLKSDVPILLGGSEADGKSDLLKEYDQNLEEVCLNNISKESLIGKSVYSTQTKEMIDVKPTWLESLEKKCENDPDNIHIIYFENIEDADSSIQNAIFNIIQQRKVNGKWDLPMNARVVISQEIKKGPIIENILKSTIPIKINPTAKKWLNWIKRKQCQQVGNIGFPKDTIHPSIYKYIESQEKDGKDVISGRGLDGIEGINTKKWEFASRIMYATNNPIMLEPLVGKKIAMDFYEFCKNNEQDKQKNGKTEYSERMNAER